MILILACLLAIDLSIDNMFHEINNVRTQYKKPPIGITKELCEVAQNYAETLARRGSISHNADGTLTDRLDRAGYVYSKCGENIAQIAVLDYKTEKDIVMAWLRSPGHRKNILGLFQECGIGHSSNIYVVVFASHQ